jgi:hypothetical protein
MKKMRLTKTIKPNLVITQVSMMVTIAKASMV